MDSPPDLIGIELGIRRKYLKIDIADTTRSLQGKAREQTTTRERKQEAILEAQIKATKSETLDSLFLMLKDLISGAVPAAVDPEILPLPIKHLDSKFRIELDRMLGLVKQRMDSGLPITGPDIDKGHNLVIKRGRTFIRAINPDHPGLQTLAVSAMIQRMEYDICARYQRSIDRCDREWEEILKESLSSYTGQVTRYIFGDDEDSHEDNKETPEINTDNDTPEAHMLVTPQG